MSPKACEQVHAMAKVLGKAPEKERQWRSSSGKGDVGLRITATTKTVVGPGSVSRSVPNDSAGGQPATSIGWCSAPAPAIHSRSSACPVSKVAVRSAAVISA